MLKENCDASKVRVSFLEVLHLVRQNPWSERDMGGYIILVHLTQDRPFSMSLGYCQVNAGIDLPYPSKLNCLKVISLVGYLG